MKLPRCRRCEGGQVLDRDPSGDEVRCIERGNRTTHHIAGCFSCPSCCPRTHPGARGVAGAGA